MSQADLVRIATPDFVGRPNYCVLHFGPLPDDRVWLARDEEHLYVDRQANCDLTRAANRVRFPQKRFGVPIDLGDVYPASLAAPVRLKMHQFVFGGGTTIYLHTWFADGRREGTAPVWAGEPQSAPVVRFYGPLTFALSDGRMAFGRGDAPSKLEVMLGRQGTGTDAFTWRNHGNVPRHLAPLAEIRFPGVLTAETIRLDRRCCGCRFHGFATIPNDAVTSRPR